MNFRSSKTALALVALALIASGTAWAQTPGQFPGSFANDGARQTADGGWVLPYDECSWDVGGLGTYLNPTDCEAHGGTWDPEALTGSMCFYNRPACLSNVFYGVSQTPPNPDVDLYPGAVDTKAECEGYGHEWREAVAPALPKDAGACSDGESRNESTCEGIAGNTWYHPACRAKFTWQTFAYTYSDATLNNYNDCTRCHNERHYPKATEEHHYHGGERSVGETYVMQSHKNMQRPVARDLNDPHYLAFNPWLDKSGEEIEQDIFGNILHFDTGKSETAPGVFADLWYLRDWIADYPEPIYTGGETDGCARCHSTGYDANYVETTSPATKQPYIMFPGFPTDMAAGGWDQWGIQCSRCHGSRLINETSGITPAMGDMRHHPNFAPSKAATNNAYPNEFLCECFQFTTYGNCQVASGLTWGEFSGTKRCYDATIDNAPAGECTAAKGTWDATNGVCYFSSMLASGATRTNLCADCHVSGSITANRVGSQHGLELDFSGHFHANQFLNSPHARFGGTATQVGDKTKYNTHFQFEGEAYPYDNTVRDKGLAGGCTQCHDVHKSALPEANPEGGFIHEECTECHAKNLAVMLHPGGKDTPMEEPTNPNHACESCHMPKTEDGRGLHFFRVSVDPTYEVFPATMFDPPHTTTVANTAPDAEGYPAVWVDLDHACGQCHGGGNTYKLVDGVVTAGSPIVTGIADTTGFAKGERIFIPGAGEAGHDLHSWVSSVGANSITLVNIPLPATSVPAATIQQNPPKAGIGYINKANLAAYAKGIHNDAPKVSFTYTLNGAQTLTALFNAAATTCNGSLLNCNNFTWEFGDGSSPLSGSPVLANSNPPAMNPAIVMPSHTFPLASSFNVTLTVTQYGMQEGEKTKVVTTYQPDLPPTATGLCTFNANTWSLSVDDNSTDDLGVKQVAITWGDGSLTTTGAGGAVFNHVYTKAGTFTVTVRVADTKGQLAQYVCTPAPTVAYFTIEGYIANSSLAALSNAKVQVFKDGTTLVKTAYSNAVGKYVASGLKPGSYTLVVTRTGYTFPAVPPVVVGPSRVGATAVNVAAN